MENLQSQGDDDGLGTFYNGENILEDLFASYNYYKSPMLNQWYFLKYKDEPYDFVNRIFDKAPNNNIVVHTLLIETIEKTLRVLSMTIMMTTLPITYMTLYEMKMA